MILIYMQSTIDFMHKTNPASIAPLERTYGKPEIKEFVSKTGDNVRYYAFDTVSKSI